MSSRCVLFSKHCKCSRVTRLTPFFVQTRPSLRTGRAVSKGKQCTKRIPKIPPPAGNGGSFANDSSIAEETQEEKLLAQKEEPILLLENRGSLSLQNVERNRDSACHETFFKERNVRDICEPSVSKNGQFHFLFELEHLLLKICQHHSHTESV